MKVGYLGPSGSFTHNVAVQVFSEESLVPYSTITEVIKAYEHKEVDYAIVPVENTIEGTVHETIDYLFHQADISAVAEVIQPIKQQLMATSADKKIEKIYSHPQAVAQGKKHIMEFYPDAEIETTASTAYAAQHVAQYPEKPYAAIAPLAAAEEYGLTIIAEDIQEIDQNYTRFWIIGYQKVQTKLEPKVDKMTLALTLPDNIPGALYKALSVFSWREIDMTKIQSRPLKTVLGEYFFIVDIVNSNAKLTAFALEELSTIGINYKVLGDYTVYEL